MNRLRFFFLPLCFSGPALAEVCTHLEDDAERLACFDAGVRCSSIDSDSDRLRCFDQVYDRVYDDAESGIEQAVDTSRHSDGGTAVDSVQSEPNGPDDAAGNTGTVAAASSPEDFGKREPSDVQEYIEATIVEIRTTGLKIDYLRLDNGQVWREVNDSRIRFKEGRRVTITEGILGSFDLQMEGDNRIAKVRRVR